MKKSAAFILVLSFLATACVGRGSGSITPNGDSADYSNLKDEQEWLDYVAERERELRANCITPEISYSTALDYCANENISLAKLNKRRTLYSRYLQALKAASVSDKVGKYTQRSMESRYRSAVTYNEYFKRATKVATERRAKQDKAIAELNKQSACKVTRNDADENQELIFTDCEPAKISDYSKTANLLEQVALYSISADRSRLSPLRDQLTRLGPQFAELARIKQNLISKGVITVNGSSVQVHGAGHPFGGLSEMEELASYAKMAKQIAANSGSLDVCASGGCDKALYEVSNALTINYMETYCSSYSGYSRAPDKDYLKSWRNLTSSNLLASLGVSFSIADKDLSSTVENDVLTYPALFQNKNIAVSISPWRKTSPCPEPATMFYYFQEAEGLAELLGRLGTDTALRVREIRFVQSGYSSKAVSAVRRADGEIRLEILTQERRTGSRSLNSVREDIYRQVPDALAAIR